MAARKTARKTAPPAGATREPESVAARDDEREQAHEAASTYDLIYAVVRRIPKGKVATYGQVAAVAGLPKHARMVGYAMAALRASSVVPWQRVVNAAGEVSPRRNEAGGRLLQRLRLEQEGVRFDARGRIDLEKYGWRPKDASEADRRTALALKPTTRGAGPRGR